MSALSANIFNWIPFAVIGASLLGSTHCVSMCGGLVLSVARTRSAWVLYHLGRLLGYLGLGSLAGFLGEKLLSTSALSIVSLVSALVLGLTFILAGAQTWKSKTFHLNLLPHGVLTLLYRLGRKSSLISGLLTALLPCGWLHSFVLAAVATQSAIQGGVLLLMFWVGTLPALGFAPWIFTRVLKPLSTHAPRISATILILIGLVTIGNRFNWPMDWANPNDTPCHLHR